jgi:MYXO-CTERM domain-containing protein
MGNFATRSAGAGRIVLSTLRRLLQTGLLVALVLGGAPVAARADTFQNVFSFPAPDGLQPRAGLLRASDGNFYGTTSLGGSAGGYGTVFRITPAGVLTTLYSFGLADGHAPQGALVEGPDGNFYGVTNTGGPDNAGTVFKITPSGTLTTLHAFNISDGDLPAAGLTLGGDGNFYGTTMCGGPSSTCYGTIFKITPGGSFTTLRFFSSADGGGAPTAAMTVGSDGNLYGTADPVIFKITLSGAYTPLYQFGFSGPLSGLTLANDGNFYGVTANGGANNAGSVFQMTPAGTVTTIYSFQFQGSGGSSPLNLTLGPDGNLYGTAGGDAEFIQGFPLSDYGDVFKITTGGSFTSLHGFSASEGYLPAGALAVGTDGNFYGVTTYGAKSGAGMVYRITPSGTLTTLFPFASPYGAGPQGSLLFGSDGALYGTAVSGGGGGGYGTVFKLTTGGSASLLHAFDQADGWFPSAGLTLGSDQNFYGTTRGNEGGGWPDPQGTVFRITPSGSFTSLHGFTTTDGANPAAPLIQGADGRFYGTTSFGGANGAGIVFAIDSAGNLGTLHTFNLNSDGGDPVSGLTLGADGNFYGASSSVFYSMTPSGGFTPLHTFSNANEGYGVTGTLVAGADGNFYGMTQQSGSGSVGSIFRVTPNGSLSVLHSFTGADGGLPTGGLIAGYDGNFYGTSQGFNATTGGTVFRISPSGAFTNLHQFPSMPGGGPQAGLVLGGDGYLYGTTTGGGDGGIGTVFRLLQPPAAPSALSAAPADGAAKLSWQSAQGASSYSVYQGTSPGGEGATPVMTGLTATQVTINGLSNGTTYYYMVQALNAGGSSLLSNEASVEPIPPPAAPTGVGAAPGNAKVTLSWNAVQYAASYSVYQGTTAGGESATPVLSGVTGTSAVLSGLANGTTYYFTIKAVNAVGISPASGEVSATPLAPPPAPAGVAVVAGGGKVTLSWSASARAAAYNVFMGTSAGGESATPVLSGISGTTATVNGLVNGTTYYFVVNATNIGGASPNSNEVAATPLTAPSGLLATAGDRSASLHWSAAAGAASYSIYQGTAAGAESTVPVLSGVTGTSANVGGLANGTTYYFVVRASNASGSSLPSNEASATPEPPAPPAPAGVTATAGNGQIGLSWTAAPGATSYNVYQGTTAGGESATPVLTTTGTSAVISMLNNGTTYYFVVRAGNAGGLSPPSAEASATPEPPSPSAPANVAATAGNGQVGLSWSAAAGATRYNIYQGTSAGGEGTTPVLTVTGTSGTIPGLNNGTAYYFVVRAANGGGLSPASAEAVATPEPPAPPAPGNLSATAADGQIGLSWTAAAGATSYNVYQGTSAGGEAATPALIVTGNSAAITGLKNGTTYYFQVRALNGGGTGPASAEVSATPEAPAKGGGAIGPWGTLVLALAAALRRRRLQTARGEVN